MPIRGALALLRAVGALLCQGDADALSRQLGLQGAADSWGSVTTAVLSPEDLLPAARKYGPGSLCSWCWRGHQEPWCHPGLYRLPTAAALPSHPIPAPAPFSAPISTFPGLSPNHGDTCHLCHSLWDHLEPGWGWQGAEVLLEPRSDRSHPWG